MFAPSRWQIVPSNRERRPWDDVLAAQFDSVTLVLGEVFVRNVQANYL
jgi:hypothetical protein